MCPMELHGQQYQVSSLEWINQYTTTHIEEI